MKYFLSFLILIGFVGSAFALDEGNLHPTEISLEEHYKIEILGLKDEYDVGEKYSFSFVISGYGHSCANYQASYPDENGKIMHMYAEVLCVRDQSMKEFKSENKPLGNIGIKKPGTYNVTVTFEKPSKYHPTTISKEFRVVESIAEDNRNIIHLEKKDIIIKFSTDKSSYSSQEPIHVAYQIKNQGEKGINYYKGDSCDDGFFGYLLNQEEKYYFERFLGAGEYLIPENNPLGEKIDDIFYGELLLMIENNETRDYGIIVYGDKKKISNALQEKHNASHINEATRLSFVTTKVPVNEILEIAKYSFVHSIGDGEQELCAQAIMRGTLDSGDGFEKSFYLSQEFYRYPGIHTLPLGNYDIVLNFRLLDENILPSESGYGASPSAENMELLTLKLPITISDEPLNVDAYEKLSSKEKSTAPVTLEPSILISGQNTTQILTIDWNTFVLEENLDPNIDQGIAIWKDGKLISKGLYHGDDDKFSISLIPKEGNCESPVLPCTEYIPYETNYQGILISEDSKIVSPSFGKPGEFKVELIYSHYGIWPDPRPVITEPYVSKSFVFNILEGTEEITPKKPITKPPLTEPWKGYPIKPYYGEPTNFPPLKQYRGGISLENIECYKSGYQLIFKLTNNSPACVNPETAQRLIERGWGTSGSESRIFYEATLKTERILFKNELAKSQLENYITHFTNEEIQSRPILDQALKDADEMFTHDPPPHIMGIVRETARTQISEIQYKELRLLFSDYFMDTGIDEYSIGNFTHRADSAILLLDGNYYDVTVSISYQN